MPELPEVETIVRDLKKEVVGKTFSDIWVESTKIVKDYKRFKNELLFKKILDIKRRGKNILFFLSSGKILLIHQKLTGHLLLGKWKRKNNKWVCDIEGPLKEDPMNSFLRLILFFKEGFQLALSDLRKFAIVEILTNDELQKKLNSLGFEPLSKNFTFEIFKNAIYKKREKKIKEVLLDQKIIAGIGNIYSNEILWDAKINPFKKVEVLKIEELKRIYNSMKKILKLAIKLRGESFFTYRTIYGQKGEFDKARKVYKRSEETCFRCGNVIKKIKLNQRSTYFCPTCQL